MPDVTGLDPVEVDNEVAVLAGDVVRDLVTRHEEEIEALEARAEEIEARAEAAERSVREHPGIAPPRRVTGAHTGGRRPSPHDGGAAITSCRGCRGPNRPVRPPATAPDDAQRGLFGRLATSHWWWRVGIALVVVAIVLLKVG